MTQNTRINLIMPPTCLRIPAVKTNNTPSVDRQAGVIRGVSVITRCEALGHGRWVDLDMVHQVVEFGNASPRGIKSRWTHPGLSADGFGTHLGRLKNFRVDGDRALADLHFSEAAKKSPTHGDLVTYIMILADEDPEAFGLSITFVQDEQKMRDFLSRNSKDGIFKSPDSLNHGSLPHFAISRLVTADVVDEPSANPNGFLTSGEELASRAESILAYAFGRSEIDPSAQMGLPPGKVREFVKLYLSRSGLRVLEVSKMDELEKQIEELKAENEALKAEIENVKAERDAALEAVAAQTEEEQERELNQLRAHVASIGPNAKLSAQIDRVAQLWSLGGTKARELARGMADEIMGTNVESKGIKVSPPVESSDFMALAKVRAAEEKISLGSAITNLARKYPNLHRDWLQAQREVK